MILWSLARSSPARCLARCRVCANRFPELISFIHFLMPTTSLLKSSISRINAASLRLTLQILVYLEFVEEIYPMGLGFHHVICTGHHAQELQVHEHNSWSASLAMIMTTMLQHGIWVDYSSITYLVDIPDHKYITRYAFQVRETIRWSFERLQDRPWCINYIIR